MQEQKLKFLDERKNSPYICVAFEQANVHRYLTLLKTPSVLISLP